VIVAVCLILGIAYGLRPQRPLAALVRGTLGWAASLGPQPSAHTVWLPPKPELAQLAHPLAEFDSIGFLGCDLSVNANDVFLITYWQLPQVAPQLDLHLRFVPPDSRQPSEVEQPLDRPLLESKVPASFLATGENGQVWLKMTQANQPVATTDAYGAQDADGWLRICR